MEYLRLSTNCKKKHIIFFIFSFLLKNISEPGLYCYYLSKGVGIIPSTFTEVFVLLLKTFATSGDKVRLEVEAFPTQSRRTCCLHGRLSGVRCGASTLCSHPEDGQQRCPLNIHTSQSALLEEGAAEAFSRSPSV